MSTKTQERRTIQVSPKVHDELTKFGLKSESYSQIVERLLFIAKNGDMAKRETKNTKELSRDFR